MVKQIIIAIVFCAFLPAQATIPERKVEGNVITSEPDPAVRIHLPKSVQYVGADRWVLYDIADCELHAFVIADSQKHVQRLYWAKPELKHTYDSPRHTNIGGMDFYVDTWVRRKDAEMRRGSDIEHILALIRAKGYTMPEGMMYVRLVHLLDEQKRKELMIIYASYVGGRNGRGWPGPRC